MNKKSIKNPNKTAGKSGLEAYEPKKNIIEKIKDLPKSYFIVLGVVIIIFFSAYSTYAVFKNNPEWAEDILGIKADSGFYSYGKTEDSSTSSKKDYTEGEVHNSVPDSEKEDLDEKTTNNPEENEQDNKENNSQEQRETDYSTLKQDLLENSFIEELPENGKILLGFYNFDKGYREWEKYYILEKNSVIEGESQERDMKIFVHSKYVPEFKDNDLCDVVGNAKNNGDLGLETEMSKTKLSWKYRGMMKYKDCLGM